MEDGMDSVKESNVTFQLAALQEQLGDLQNLMEQRFAEVSSKLDGKVDMSPVPLLSDPALDWMMSERTPVDKANMAVPADQPVKRTGSRRGPASPVCCESTASVHFTTEVLRFSTMSPISNASNRSALSTRLNGMLKRSTSKMIWDATTTQRKAAKLQAQHLGERRNLMLSPAHSAETLGSRSSWVRNLLGTLMDSVFVTHGVMLLVFAHALLLGFEIDWIARSLPHETIPEWFSIANLIIVSIFVLELLLKFLHLGCSEFWCGMDCGWNVFDGCIVTLCVADVIIDFWSRWLTASTAVEELGTWRTLRFIRAVQTIRIVRIFRYVVSLRILAVSILATMSSLLWTLALLAMIFYAFSLILTQQVAEHCRFILVDNAGQSQCSGDLVLYWGSVAKSGMTLFMAIAQGIDWQVALKPLWEVSYFAVCALLLYVSITILAILNVVTGVFCNTAMESASRDKDVAARNLAATRSHQAKQLKEVFQQMDHLDLNAISIQDLDVAMESTELQHFLESMGISTDDIWTLFLLLDVEEKGVIEIDAFVSGCIGMYGTARSMQMAKLSYENTLLRHAVAEFKGDVAKEFARLKELIRTFTTEVHISV